jgi:hypothetical protein
MLARYNARTWFCSYLSFRLADFAAMMRNTVSSCWGDKGSPLFFFPLRFLRFFRRTELPESDLFR